MTVGMDDGKFYLIDNWPGIVTDGPNPADWVTPSSTEDFPLGTKRAIYDDTNNGWATLMYLKYEKGSAAAVGIKGLCSPDTTEGIAAGGYCIVTNDGGESMNSGPIAVALATMADGEYGWFWVGGVCPVDTITGLAGSYASDGGCLTGCGMQLADNVVNRFVIYDANATGLYPSAFALAADENVAS